MPTPESAFCLTEERLDQLKREAIKIFIANDGQIDQREQSIIDGLGEIQNDMLVGDAARIHAESIHRTWDIDGSPRSQRRIRELTRDRSVA